MVPQYINFLTKIIWLHRSRSGSVIQLCVLLVFIQNLQLKTFMITIGKYNLLIKKKS